MKKNEKRFFSVDIGKWQPHQSLHPTRHGSSANVLLREQRATAASQNRARKLRRSLQGCEPLVSMFTTAAVESAPRQDLGLVRQQRVNLLERRKVRLVRARAQVEKPSNEERLSRSGVRERWTQKNDIVKRVRIFISITAKLVCSKHSEDTVGQDPQAPGVCKPQNLLNELLDAGLCADLIVRQIGMDDFSHIRGRRVRNWSTEIRGCD